MCISASKKTTPGVTVAGNQLKLTFWNIHGHKSKLVGDKLSDNEFLNTFRDDHIVGLVELHTDVTPSIQGFKLIKQKIRKKLHKGPKIAGGLAVFAKLEFAQMVKPVHNDNDDSIWVKLNKEDTGESKDIYIGTLYLSPGRDGATRDEGRASLETFFQESRKFREKGLVVLQGEFHAHTATLPDFIENDKSDDVLGIENNDKPLIRNSEDKKAPNDRGKLLIDLCQAYDVLIVNGRKTGDIFGNYTSFQWNGSRVVDYVLTEGNQLQKISDFKVDCFRPWLSDHCPLRYSISLTRQINQKQKQIKLLIPLPIPQTNIIGIIHPRKSLKNTWGLRQQKLFFIKL